MVNGNSSRTYQWIIALLVTSLIAMLGVVFGRVIEGNEIKTVKIELRETTDKTNKNEIRMHEYIKNTDTNITEIKDALKTIQQDIKGMRK